MKILTSQQIREADAYTIEHEPISSIDLMERASRACANWLLGKIGKEKRYIVFVGMGNNGGDGLAIARLLADEGVDVTVHLVRHSEKQSLDCVTNLQRLHEQGKVQIHEVITENDLPQIESASVVIDAMLGSGLSKPVAGLIGDIVHHINHSAAMVVAIDIPTGLFGEDNTDNDRKKIIKADTTLTFQLPKLAMMFADNYEFVGEWQVLPIGLHQDYISKAETPNHYLLAGDIKASLKLRGKFSHKGTFGHALLLAGCKGKMGAAVMAAKSALRAGAGLLTAHLPQCGYEIMQTALPEAMVSIDEELDIISCHPKLDGFAAIGVGPGIGTDDATANALKQLIQNANVPIVFDADAINMLAENKTWIPFIKSGSIFTPHPKEFERLVGKASDGYSRLQMQREFAAKNGVYVVLKGAHTSIACPDGTCYFNSTGNPGMAKGGSGDVLTGVILGLLAQGYSSKEAALIGVFLHGHAGDLAKEKHGEQAMLPSDIIDGIGSAYLSIG